MKTRTTFLAFALCIGLMAGCSKNSDDMWAQDPETDNSLAGSLRICNQPQDADMTLFGQRLSDFKSSAGVFALSKKSDKSVNMTFVGVWGEKLVSVIIPDIRLSGRMYDVDLSKSLTDGSTLVVNSDSLHVKASINGWIRARSAQVSDADPNRASDQEMAYNDYMCDLHIVCQTADNKKAILTLATILDAPF